MEIQKEAFLDQAKIYNNYKLPPLTQNIESFREEYREKIVLKYEVQNRIIGSVRYKDEGGTVTVDRLVVKPSEQSKGIGTRLLQAVEEMNPEATKFRLFTGSKSERNIDSIVKSQNTRSYASRKQQVTKFETSFSRPFTRTTIFICIKM